MIPFLSTSQPQSQLRWDVLPPVSEDNNLIGMFGGVSGDAVLCLGGLRVERDAIGAFKDESAEDGIYVWKKGASTWKLASKRLPESLAFGVSLAYRGGILLIGGSNTIQHSAAVYNVIYNDGDIRIDTLRSLPYTLANMTGAIVGSTIFIAGGNTHPSEGPGMHFMTLDLESEDLKWKALPAWPGGARKNAISASLEGDFFLIGGLGCAEDGMEQALYDGYRYTSAGEWKQIAAISGFEAMNYVTAPTIGFNHLFLPVRKLVGGDSSKHYVSRLYGYNVNSNVWADYGEMHANNIYPSNAVIKWKDTWVFPIAEQGAISAENNSYTLSRNLHFGGLNWVFLIGYLILMIWIGTLFNKKDKSTDDFFKAGGRIPWWAAGISIFGAQVSAITFMAIPAIVFATDWSLFFGTVIGIAVIPIVVKYYVPFFRRLSVTSAYEYLEYRFNATVRLIGSISFILFQLGRMGIVLFLPALAISSVTGIDIYLLIVVVGVICIVYTMLGGIEAVIWADVVQVLVLIGGAVLCLIVAVSNVEAGLEGVIDKGFAAGKFTLYHSGWNPNEMVLWVCLVGFFFLNLIPYSSDQAVIQKYLTVKDERAAGKSLWINAIISIPASIVFFAIGTALFVFYMENPAILPADEVGEVLPYFIVNQLPIGIAGLVIAGIFAASQSALSSSMNSVAAAYVTDVHDRVFTNQSHISKIRLAKISTVFFGIIGTSIAVFIALFKIQFIFDLFQEILGIACGSLTGAFILGIFTKRTDSVGVITGMISGIVLVCLIRVFTDVNVYLYGAISVLTCMLIGYLASGRGSASDSAV